jgi:hypothetical protein
MNSHNGFKSGRDRGSSLLSYVGVRRDGSSDGLSSETLTGLLRGDDSTPEAPIAPGARHAQPEAAEGAKAATEAADDSAQSALAVTEAADDSAQSALAAFTLPAVIEDAGASTAAVGDDDAAGMDSAAGLLALAQKLHNEYVAEGRNTREKLISEGQLRHDQVVGEATARHEELCSTGQAKHDEFVSVGETRHDALIAQAEALVAEAHAEHEHIISEARELSTEMVAEAQRKKAEVLYGLGRERSVLQTEIDELRTFEHDDRARLKSYHEGQLTQLEHAGADETDDEPV